MMPVSPGAVRPEVSQAGVSQREALRGDPTFDMFADALDAGHYREVPRPDSPEESQIHDFISGWLASKVDAMVSTPVSSAMAKV